MSDLFEARTPRNQLGESGRKRSLGIQLGVLTAGLVGGYGLLSGVRPTCVKPPEPGTPEALQFTDEQYQQQQKDFEQCRRRRSSSSSSSSSSSRNRGWRWGSSSSSSNRASVSRGGFGRSGSFGG
jgi:hypothetical protein